MERDEWQDVWKHSSKKKSQILFSLTCWRWNLCIHSPDRQLTLGSYASNSSVNIKINCTMSSTKIHHTKNQGFVFFSSKGILTFSLAFLLVPASIHSFSFSSMSIKAQRTPSINSSIYKKYPKRQVKKQETSDKVFWATRNSSMLSMVGKRFLSSWLYTLATFLFSGKSSSPSTTRR